MVARTRRSEREKEEEDENEGTTQSHKSKNMEMKQKNCHSTVGEDESVDYCPASSAIDSLYDLLNKMRQT
jgi:hypothetical protein